MKKISSIAVIAVVVSMGTQIAFAQETTLTNEPVVTTTAVVNNSTKQAPTTIRERVKEEATASKNALQEKLEKAKEEVSSERADLKTKIQKVRETASTTRGEIKQKADEMRVEIQNKKEELRNKLETKRVEIAKSWGEKTMKRLDETVLRLQKVADRIDSRIAKMKINKIDTTKAEESLIIAKQKITQAKEDVSAARLAITGLSNQATATPSTDKNILGQNIQKIKDQVRKVTESLKSAHQALVQATTELKGKEGVKKDTASTTEETKTN